MAVLDEVDNTLRVYLNTCTAPGPNLTVHGWRPPGHPGPGQLRRPVADRRTVVRAYVGTDAATPAVTAALHGFRPTVRRWARRSPRRTRAACWCPTGRCDADS
ncbi:hypothetical protein V2I01_32170 [Micromonospora sp. BRA006-A]|nr:hypothetical protein [Micromonospora sp. BRA006-A]